MDRIGVSVVALVLGSGCTKGPAPAQPSPAAAPTLVDATRAAQDPDELDRAFAASRRALGAHRLHGKSSVSVSDGGAEVEELYEETLVERAPNGDLHARYQNSRDQGREIVAAGGTVWLRPGFGKFHRRPPVDPGEVERSAEEIGGVLAADFDLCAGQIAVRDGGAVTVGGRAARKVVLALGPPRPRPVAIQGGWRAGAAVQSLAGEVTVDDSTGAILGGRLQARVAFAQGGRKLVMDLNAEETIELAGVITVAAPADADSVATPGRKPDFDDREELLGGLAPSARRGANAKP